MQAIDYAIVGLYILATVVIGLVARRRAATSVEAYYLAGKSLPWYMLSLSNASGLFDISGTMWLVALLVVYGMKSIWIPWLWPVFNQVFLMVYLSTWLRRSRTVLASSARPRPSSAANSTPVTPSTLARPAMRSTR